MIDSSLKFLLDLIFVVFKKTFLLWVRVPDKEIFSSTFFTDQMQYNTLYKALQ